MKNPVSPQDGTPELKEQLAKAGIKMPERKSRRRDQDTLNKVNGGVQISNANHPNSGSSYNGIFGY
jgi:hypothetical protein